MTNLPDPTRRPAEQFSLLVLLGGVAIIALCLAIWRLNPRLFIGIILTSAGMVCAVWKVRRYRRRGFQELRSEIAHLLLGPSVFAAVLMLVVGVGLIFTSLIE